ncbi:MAG: response regulator transcription factor [Saprospiraceae bacterium]
MKVLVCEADAVLLSAIEFRLRKYGFDMKQTTLKDVSKKLEDYQPDLIILDTENNPAESLQLVHRIKEKKAQMPIIIVSPLEDEEELWQAIQQGADDFVTKPFKLIELVLRVRRLLNSTEKTGDGSSLRINI